MLGGWRRANRPNFVSTCDGRGDAAVSPAASIRLQRHLAAAPVIHQAMMPQERPADEGDVASAAGKQSHSGKRTYQSIIQCRYEHLGSVTIDLYWPTCCANPCRVQHFQTQGCSKVVVNAGFIGSRVDQGRIHLWRQRRRCPLSHPEARIETNLNSQGWTYNR